METSQIDNSAPVFDIRLDNEARQQLVVFGVKVIIVAAAVLVSLIILVVVLDKYVESTVDRVTAKIQESTKVGGTRFWSKVEQEIDRAADPSRGLSPETRQKLLKDLRAISAQWRPFLSEAYGIIENANAPPPAK